MFSTSLHHSLFLSSPQKANPAHQTQTVKFQGVYELSEKQRGKNNKHDPDKYSTARDNLIVTNTKQYGLDGRDLVSFQNAGRRVTELEAAYDALDSEEEDQASLDSAHTALESARLKFYQVIEALKARAIAPVLLERPDIANR